MYIVTFDGREYTVYTVEFDTVYTVRFDGREILAGAMFPDSGDGCWLTDTPHSILYKIYIFGLYIL